MNKHTSQEDEINLSEFFAVVWNGKWWVASVICIFLVLAVIHVTVAKPVYQANALIQVEEKQSGLAGFGDLAALMEGESSGSTEIEVIKSRFVLGGVVEEQLLQLSVHPDYFPVVGEYISYNRAGRKDTAADPLLGLNNYHWGGESLTVSQFYIDDRLAPRVIKLRVDTSSSYSLYNTGDEFLGGGAIDEVVSVFDGGLVISVASIIANVGTSFTLIVQREVDASNSLKSRLSVSEKGRDTGIIALSLKGVDRDSIKASLSSVVNIYQKQNVKRLSEEADRSIRFLEVQVPAIRKQLEEAEQKLNGYRAKHSSLNMELETKAALDQLVTIESQLSELELKESDISSRYKKDHPLYSSLLEQRGSLSRERKRINTTVEKLPATQQQLLRLMRDVEVSNQIYLQLLGKMEELKVIRAGTVGNVRILEDAEAQTWPIAPKKSAVVIGAFFIGGLLGLLIVFIRHVVNPAIKNPLDVQDKLSIPSYGVIPISKTQEQLVRGGKPGVLAQIDKKDLSLEAIRSIRTSLHFAMMEAKNNIVMLTGASPGIGKSFVSANLAALIGESNHKVLLIDADMRRGHMNKAFDVIRNPGLSEYLSQSYLLDQVCHKNISPSVDFVATGSIPPNPSELLMSQRFESLLEEAARQYDIVIIDTPPTLAVTDAMIVGKHAGTTMAVVRHNRNSLREIQQMKEGAETVGIVIKGYIYNFMDFETSTHTGDTYYNYGYYGMDEGEDKV